MSCKLFIDEEYYKWNETFIKNVEELFENLEDKNDAENTYSEEKQRIKIFYDALLEKRGITWVSNKLKEKNLRAIYMRNPIELVLAYCLECNDTKNAYKTYDFKDFIDITKHLPKFSPPENIIVTFGDLCEYVEDHNDFVETPNEAQTLRPETLEMYIKLDDIDKTLQSAESLFFKLYGASLEKLVNVSDSIRYYVCKYAYLALSAQIYEFIDILKLCAQSSAEQMYNYFLENPQSCWTLANSITAYFEVESSKENPKKIQINKLVLDSLAKSFPLCKAPKGSVREVPFVFVHTGRDKSETVIDLCQLHDEVSIFGNSRTKELHRKKVDSINNLKLSNFYDFQIDFEKLYELLVTRIARNYYNTVSNNKAREKLLKSIFSGTHDVSRSFLLTFLAGAKATIETSNASLPYKVLDVDRVNAILNRVGYVSLLPRSKNSFDYILKSFFDVDVEAVSTTSYIEAFVDAVDDYVGERMPFEITRESAEVIHKELIEKKG